ncbi:MAG: sigma-70 family RNA polymerase sigma factor [Gammaproteobacteria bacterium]
MSSSEMNPESWLQDHGEALYAFAMMRVHNSAAAEDILQETLIAGIQGVAKFKQGSSVRTWLISIMKNKIIDLLRKTSRETPLEENFLNDDDFDDQFGSDGHWKQAPREWREPMSLLEAGETKRQLLECISLLPEKLRTLIVLKEIDGFETQELILMLNISSANNLWVMLSRARDKLRLCMDDHVK